jgi:putative FmdB family regulatory protein
VPIYEYVCHHCGHRFDVVHGLHAEGPMHCPSCHLGPVRKAFVPPTIHFKGSGWAKKDRGASVAPPARSPAGGKEGPAVPEPASASTTPSVSTSAASSSSAPASGTAAAGGD